MLDYYKELLLYIKNKVSNKDNAQDIVQETYERVIAISNTQKIENERALLYKVAKNLIIDLSRKNKNITEIPFEKDTHIEKYLTEDEVIKQNQQDILMQELKKLPAKRKEAFVLHIIEGYTKEEVANIMNISFQAVEKHISRATIELKEKIRKKEEL
ncbi:sigma factor, ECF family [Aliarcobacter faecis]|uniref:RNA polymerase sigma factor n=1 Tax=Aliarcobacter faecis TaxID=1564138 RepID=UPI000479A0E0|nr:RNA polymerase sigma factor [Aliarcobacter faecis]QKF73079.1 sigma factor, ECF family [Aliarcobacter faecis]